ncbi:MAG: MerR family transcriptional regulator [Planctomycetota bacterium]|nr:MerR family transcriptional regulator [Planctomycetota bacterium]
MTLTAPGDTLAHALTLPPKRYRIGELVQHTGLTRQTIHNYTRWGLISAVEHTGGGHRLYDDGVFARLETIRRLKPSRPLAEIRHLLESAATPS